MVVSRTWKWNCTKGMLKGGNGIIKKWKISVKTLLKRGSGMAEIEVFVQRVYAKRWKWNY